MKNQTNHIQIHPINPGNFKLDGGSMFGIVPKNLWQKLTTPDSQNRITLATRVLLIKTPDQTILVDTGLGNYHDPKFQKIYAPDTPNPNFQTLLAPYQTTPDDITDIIITHLHFDHAAGLLHQNHTGQLAPTFPNAQIWLQKKHLQWAQNPSSRDAASFLPQYLDVLKNHPKLNLIEGRHNITPNITVIPSHSHTPGLQTVLINTPNETLFFPSELIPTAAHLHIPYIAAFDLDPVLATHEKQQALTQAASHNWTVIFQHDPIITAAKITQQNNKFVLKSNLTPPHAYKQV